VLPGFTADKFNYDKRADVYVCSAGQRLAFSPLFSSGKNDLSTLQAPKGRLLFVPVFMTKCKRNRKGRVIWRWVHEEVMDEMRIRVSLCPKVMDERRKVAEHPFGTLKRAFGAPYLLLKVFQGLVGRLGCL
jgi:hypothetical protein